MAYTRVLGTIGLLGATVLGAIGPVGALQPAHATTRAAIAAVAGKAAALQALRNGYVTIHGHRYYLSAGLTGSKGVTALGTKSSGALSAARAGVSPQPAVGGGVRANQDFGFFETGTGVLFHNTLSVAVDPVASQHVVVSATDTRLGSDGAFFNTSSDPINNSTIPGTFVVPSICFATVDVTTPVPAPCALIQALGGPGVYDSTNGAKNFTDLIIPDALTGAVPDALNLTVAARAINTTGFTIPVDAATGGIPGTTSTTSGTPAVTTFFTQAAIGCIPPSGAFAPIGTPFTPGLPTDCLPYDSVGDQSVAFDSSGNLYDVALGLVSSNPILTNAIFTDGPQTDVLLNVSPAVQPVNPTSVQTGQPVGNSPVTNSQVAPPEAAGRVFNAAAMTGACNPMLSSTVVCQHDEVIASTMPSNFLTPSIIGPAGTAVSNAPLGVEPGPAFYIGRNWQADDLAGGSGKGVCGVTDFCLIDQPYLAINSVVDPVAYVTYTLIDFGSLGPAANVYFTTALVPAGSAAATSGVTTLPVWTAPKPVDNSNAGATIVTANPFCGGNTCADSWGAEPAIGPNGGVYVAYENADNNDTSAATLCNFGLGCNAILVATIIQPSATNPFAFVSGTAIAGEALDHDSFNASAATTSLAGVDPAGLDPASGAFFTIPNRPTIAVTGQTCCTTPGGFVIVAWTDQRSLSPAGGAMSVSVTATAVTSGFGTGATLNVVSGTRIWYAVGRAKSPGPLSFITIANPNATAVPNPTFVNAEVFEPPVTCPCAATGGVQVRNQFFPWLTASQTPLLSGAGTVNLPNNIFIGFYQETPGVYNAVTGATTTNPYLQFMVGKMNDEGSGNTFGVSAMASSMPLPNVPVSAATCSAIFGFTYPGSTLPVGVPTAVASAFTDPLTAQAACNATPYFGTYIGIYTDSSNVPLGVGSGNGTAYNGANGAYVAWVDTNQNTRNFQVAGSQDVYVGHIN